MATWPDVTEALENIGNTHTTSTDIVTQCLAAAVEYLTYRCTIELDEEDVPAVPESVRRACLLLTARLFRRVESPEGVASFGEFGAVRVQKIDPDIEAMLLPARSWGIA